MEPFIHNLQIWLSQPLPLLYLVASVACLLLVFVCFAMYRSKQMKLMDLQRQGLEINRASQEQLISNLSEEKVQLTNKVNENSAQIAQLSAYSAELKSSRDEKQLQLTQTQHERQGLRDILDNEQRKIARLEADVREQNAKLAAEYDKIKQLKEHFEQSRADLKSEFKVVSEEVLKERQSRLNEQNKEGVDALLKPLKEQIEGFQKRVNEVHDESVRGNTHLKAQIDSVMQMGIQMRDEATNLTKALTGQSQQRGAWGEVQLERTLQMSGLHEHDHYDKQSAFTDEQGKRKITDYIIKLPDNKCIIIDSKVSLNAYERAIGCEGAEQRQAMAEHVQAVRQHINDLAGKEYINLDGLHSPDFVLMFMPIEPAYIEAMKEDRQLFAYGYERNIIMVSHTTLIPILRTVANLWTLDRSHKEARLIGDKANEIFDSVALVSSRLEDLGKTLNTASNHYNNTVTAISGKQGLQGKVERFATLSSKANKNMPELNDKQMEFDTSKLSAQRLSNDESESKDNQEK